VTIVLSEARATPALAFGPNPFVFFLVPYGQPLVRIPFGLGLIASHLDEILELSHRDFVFAQSKARGNRHRVLRPLRVKPADFGLW
jgi:hypothetical protein